MAMPGWAKALIIVGVVLVLLVVGLIAGGAYWWSQNKERLTGGLEEGKTVGKTTDNQGCVDKSMERYKTERGMMSVIGTTVFMTACLPSSRPTPGFCDGVPREFDFRETATWRATQCQRFDMSGDKFCPQLFAPVQKFCEHRGRTTSSDEQTNSN